jgi:hypothetical protein
MHTKFFFALSIAGLLVASSACTGVIRPTFPTTDHPRIKTAEDFDSLAATVNDLKDETIRIAGKKVRVEEKEEGLFVVAEWLPYPRDDMHFTEFPGSQPTMKKAGGRRFTFLYPRAEQVSALAKWRGNQFILLANIKGQKQIPVSLTGRLASVPYLEAQCMRVWKTGGSQIGYAPDSDLGAYPPIARTYCLD